MGFLPTPPVGVKRRKLDFTSGKLDYVGLNGNINAGDGDATWHVYKLTWNGENPTVIDGPVIGSWTGRAGLFS